MIERPFFLSLSSKLEPDPFLSVSHERRLDAAAVVVWAGYMQSCMSVPIITTFFGLSAKIHPSLSDIKHGKDRSYPISV
jgi:hypothetical protein